MHYANGREAKVGDPVVGKVYNTPGIVAGTLVSLTPGPESCNAEVEFIIATSSEPGHEAPRMALRPFETNQHIRKTQEHGSSGPLAAFYRCRDHTHVGQLLHAEDAHDHLLAATAEGP